MTAMNKQALEAALDAYKRHASSCGVCDQACARWCGEGRRLWERYYEAWLAYHNLLPTDKRENVGKQRGRPAVAGRPRGGGGWRVTPRPPPPSGRG